MEDEGGFTKIVLEGVAGSGKGKAPVSPTSFNTMVFKVMGLEKVMHHK